MSKHLDYIIHIENIEECLNCDLPNCIYDYDKFHPIRQVGCAYENAKRMTGNEVIVRRHKKRRKEAFEKIANYINNGEKINLKQASSLTGLSRATLRKCIQRGNLIVKPWKQGYTIIGVVYE